MGRIYFQDVAQHSQFSPAAVVLALGSTETLSYLAAGGGT